MKLKDRILEFVNKPVDNILSSQTLYEALFANINMYLAYHEKKHEKRCHDVANLIARTQLADGGFDIGYNFSFGDNMTKKSEQESTTPEIVSLFALLKYYEIFKNENIVPNINKAVNWIKEKSYKNEDNLYVIPYAPCSYHQVHITNAISFTVAALGYYSYLFNDNTVKPICADMLKYLKSELIIKDNKGYWNYFEKSLMSQKSYIKVDNYHIAQQLYYHILLNNYFENKDNQDIIKLVTNYLQDKLEQGIAVPYIEIGEKVTTDIHSWGYCSLLLCALQWKDKQMTSKILDYIMKNMIVEDHFAPIIKNTGEIINKQYYPRSDAWLLHSLSEYLLLEENKQEVYEIVEKGLDKLENINYRGLENHVYTFRKMIFSNIVRILKNRNK